MQHIECQAAGFKITTRDLRFSIQFLIVLIKHCSINQKITSAVLFASENNLSVMNSCFTTLPPTQGITQGGVTQK